MVGAAPWLFLFIKTFFSRIFMCGICKLSFSDLLACASCEWNLKEHDFVTKLTEKETTVCGGSLGSCVDEERSQLRELM